jgi:hypothetical protein
MRVLEMMKVETGRYRIAYQNEKILPRPCSYVLKVDGLNTVFESSALPSFSGGGRAGDTIKIWLKGGHHHDDDRVFEVEDDLIGRFEKSVLALNQLYSNNTLEIEDVILT